MQATLSPSRKREELQRIRRWAQKNGYNPSTRGRTSHSILDAYNEAQK
ncbi:histone-like nucleoid-structuring protein Lsr2 [Arthrobacter sp. CAN_C5]